MKIETFQKIQQRLIEVTLLPLSFFITISIYFWQSLWDKHIVLTVIAFIVSSLFCLYYLSINITNKPWIYLKQVYKNNKKYKTLRKIEQLETQEPQKSTFSSVPEKQQEALTANLIKKPVHLSFNLEDDEEIGSPSKLHKPGKQQKSLKPPSKRFTDAKNLGKTGKKPQRNPNQLDPLEMFLYSSKQAEIPKDRKKINYDETQKTEQDLIFEQESQEVKRCISKLISKQQSEDKIRKDFEKRYNDYEKSLQEFKLNKLTMQRLIDQTKLVIREKIEENLKKQFQNLDKIENILRKNFSVNFKSYRERSENRTHNLYGQSLGFNQNRNSLNQIQDQNCSLNKPLKFSEVLQECVNLMNYHYFQFQYTGEAEKIDNVKNELKLLIKQRIQLDEYLFLRNSLSVDGSNKDKYSFSSQFEDQRYSNIMKLKNLAQILGQKKSAQQNLLKQFFSIQRTFINQANQPVEQINDEKNIEFLMVFMIKVFKEKLQSANASDYIQIQFSKPNFSDPAVNYIWVARSRSSKSHYNLAYTCNIQVQGKFKQSINPEIRGQKTQQKQKKPYRICCCPGETNIWNCLTFIRQIISKIGLKKEKYPMIRDNELKKDFQRLIQLLS